MVIDSVNFNKKNEHMSKIFLLRLKSKFFLNLIIK